MANRKRALGKGLDALLGPLSAVDVANIDSGEALRKLPIDLLQRSPYQPRMDFDKDALQELANSIKSQGVVQPLLVRPLARSGRFEIIAGERRWRAAQQAGLHEIPAVVRQLDDRATMCIALIENIQRQDLNPLEQARGLSRLIDEFDMTHEAIAGAVGRSRSSVTNLLRLLELNDEVKRLLEARALEMGHARALLALPSEKQLQAAREIIQSGLPVRGAEALVRHLQGGRKPKQSKAGPIDPNIKLLQSELSEQLGATVSIHQQKGGKGSVQISYGSLDELDGILAKIRGKPAGFS